MSISVNIKNSGKTYPLELDPSDTGLIFKTKIQNLTKIPIDRQKILLKTGQLQNDVVVSQLNLKPNQIIMVLGSPELNLPIAPINTIFKEDLDESSLQSYSNDPIGFENLGNTCYLNSSIQALYSIPSLHKALEANQKIGEIGTNEHLVLQLKQIFNQLRNKKEESIVPNNLITSLRVLYPQFNERDQYGSYKQQDAEEAFTQLLLSLKTVLGDEFIQDFTINFKSTIKNQEDESDVQFKNEEDLKLSCHITGSTNFLKNGILESLNETIEKHSEKLNKNCQYDINKKISKLPSILTVQFVRFFWKRSTNKKSKILRKVQFPFQLDLADVLDDDYREEKTKIRDELRSIEKKQQLEERDFKKQKKHVNQQDEEDFFNKQYNKYLDEFKEKFPKNLSPGENPSSIYNLNAIITHQGSSADSGHYQAFVKDKFDDNKWWRFNDDKISIVDKDRIESLSGGGESDSALILIYKGFGLE
ncbi:putative ubiquitin carboxyl-terminal hydrolase [Wickerhamomyces ciferrii]|uniref:Ubiquitin carboxyl-terminal hydrolase n=1 Tax=Wickerhamomyces ciferrii (strain ATCC 14091 / BCRC 22168 / CBS 111 / JCM 3599 / NBRC 0793 / NRRL Y-1031 F-60-10) TaxID=1206466 RepID=K0KIW3_WICCF|nr:putative ubiquitin carboxyl-terminal hydrolase [Wickerhamomyces ciferrii]CCH41374.1 putative ubiquitin carboxyl-terminal hydrolase [Wickerhamomyces ciferrii]